MAERGSQQRVDTAILTSVLDLLRRGDLAAGAKIDAIFEAVLARKLAKIAGLILPELGETVLGGPFAGMSYRRGAAEGCILPKILGSYEAELAPVIERVASVGYETIVNVGCAEGYYAVGLARRSPASRLLAHDSDPAAREACAALAVLNGVGDRVEIGGALTPADWSRFAGGRVFVMCDIEGDEFALLDPRSAPALAGFDLLVELHAADAMTPDDFAARFADSHDVEWIAPRARNPEEWPALSQLTPADRAFALIERLEPTPWLFLRSTMW